MTALATLLAALVLVLVGACGQPEAQTAPVAQPETAATTEVEPAGATETPAELAAAAPPVDGCGIVGTTDDERVNCTEDTDCNLSRIDFSTCRANRCGPARHAYNCAFITRLEVDCDTDACEEFDGAGDLPCRGGGGGGPSWEAACIGGACRPRVATVRATSRQLSVEGALSERDVMRAFRRSLRTVEACLPPTIAVETRPVIDVVVSPAGRVTGVEAMRDHGLAPDAMSCAQDAIRGARFPAADGPTTFRHLFGPVHRAACSVPAGPT